VAFQVNKDRGVTSDTLRNVVGADEGALSGLDKKEWQTGFTSKSGSSEKTVEAIPPWQQGTNGREFGSLANDPQHPIQGQLSAFVEKLQQGPFPLYPPETDRMAGLPPEQPPVA